MPVTEVKGSVFDAACALAHCVGADFVMRAGIAVEFKARFRRQDELIGSCGGVGTCSCLVDTPDMKTNVPRTVFYLVTKPLSRRSKPTYVTLESSLRHIFVHAMKLGLTDIAMPRIGCGLDGLHWAKVKCMLEELCPPILNITVYSL